MFDYCLVALVKLRRLLVTPGQLIKLLELWYNISKYANKIFLYLELSYPPLGAKTNLPFPSQGKKKTNFQALQASKKVKNMHNLIIAQDAQMTAF